MDNLPDTIKTNMPTISKTRQASLFFDIARFEHAQRIAKMLTASTMVPEHFRNNIGNTMIALNYADRIGADPFMVMQTLYVVKGNPGIEGQLVIGLVNQCGRFDPIEFEEDEDGCLAYAKELKSGKTLKGVKIDWDMVKKEGWYDKPGSKWKTIPKLMFRYRAATYFARTYCPEVLLGMQTREELIDYIDLEPAPNGTYEAGQETPKSLAERIRAKNPPNPKKEEPQKKEIEYPQNTKTTTEEAEGRLSEMVKNEPEYQELMQVKEMFPEHYETAIKKYGEPKNPADCQQLIGKIHRLVDAEANKKEKF